MPHLTDPADIRSRLERDRVWSAFSIADLDEPYATHAHWFGDADPSALVLVYAAFDPPIVYLQGTSEACIRILRQEAVVRMTSAAWLNVLPLHADAVADQFACFKSRLMVRMVLAPEFFVPVSHPALARLGPADEGELDALYADDRPAFFVPSQLRDGVYYGVRERGRLVSVAGTHVVSERGRVGALGNVYTTPAHRGRGLAAAATSAVCAEFFRRGITTIVLNIIATNAPARRAYERIGFREYCRYEEGEARR
jgi:RimJ/RimL family protein N-acetyltransferase